MLLAMIPFTSIFFQVSETGSSHADAILRAIDRHGRDAEPLVAAIRRLASRKQLLAACDTIERGILSGNIKRDYGRTVGALTLIRAGMPLSPSSMSSFSK